MWWLSDMDGYGVCVGRRPADFLAPVIDRGRERPASVLIPERSVAAVSMSDDFQCSQSIRCTPGADAVALMGYLRWPHGPELSAWPLQQGSNYKKKHSYIYNRLEHAYGDRTAL